VGAGARSSDAGDQRDVADQPVHRAEHRRPQPPADDVAVVVVDLGGGRARRGRAHGARVRPGAAGCAASGAEGGAGLRSTKNTTAPTKTAMLTQSLSRSPRNL